MNINNFDELLAWVKNNKLASIETLTIDLAIARDNLLYEVAGLVIYASDGTDNSCNLQIRHNEQSNGLITITKNYGVEFPFYRLYLTNTAQAGKTITLIIGRAAPFDIKDNRSTLDILTTLQQIRDELQGISSAGTFGSEISVDASPVQILAANTNRKGGIIFVSLTSPGPVYIGFDNTVLTTKYAVKLEAGTSWSFDDYRGPLYAIASTSGRICTASEW